MTFASSAPSNDRGISRSFKLNGDGTVSQFLEIDEFRSETVFPVSDAPGADPFVSYTKAALSHRPLSIRAAEKRRKVNVVDLFCGAGGMSLGVDIGLKELGYEPRQLAAFDKDRLALSHLSKVFRPLYAKSCDVNDLIEYTIDHSPNQSSFISPPKLLDGRLSQFRNKVDLLIGGPPCQGHSSLNNATRGFDSRNLLYYVMPAMALALNVPVVLIENVRRIESSAENVTQGARSIFEAAGYNVYESVLGAVDYGVAQTRVRHFMLATKTPVESFELRLECLKQSPLSFDDINSNLSPLQYHSTMLEIEPSGISEENRERIKFLHSDASYNLPNELRPDCHKDGHTYPSVYGRINGSSPAQTITSGFGSPGRGRFIHPHLPRLINIREASRLQGIPDWYWESAEDVGFKRATFYKTVGDAVPPALASAVIHAAAGVFE